MLAPATAHGSAIASGPDLHTCNLDLCDHLLMVESSNSFREGHLLSAMCFWWSISLRCSLPVLAYWQSLYQNFLCSRGVVLVLFVGWETSFEALQPHGSLLRPDHRHLNLIPNFSRVRSLLLTERTGTLTNVIILAYLCINFFIHSPYNISVPFPCFFFSFPAPCNIQRPNTFFNTLSGPSSLMLESKKAQSEVVYL